MDKFNLVDLGNIGEPAANVINNFINKIFGALGWLVMPKNIHSSIIEANKSIIEEISNREDINPIERAAIINNYKKIVKEYRNQIDIIKIASEHLNSDAKPEMVSDDWITFFFEKVKGVTEDDMKIIWSRILAGEFNEPNTYTNNFYIHYQLWIVSWKKDFKKLEVVAFIHLHIYMLLFIEQMVQILKI